ncbi:MAG: hypothetical protein ISS70_17525 [Phycisphaerae bacterium]|nr:hypothetical protein [Phycisphaerae bacterium]
MTEKEAGEKLEGHRQRMTMANQRVGCGCVSWAVYPKTKIETRFRIWLKGH